MMTANDYLNLLDRSILAAFNPIAKTIVFMDKCLISNTVDGKIYEVDEEFNEALRAMPCQKFSRKPFFIKSRHVRIYLEKLVAQERLQKLKLLI